MDNLYEQFKNKYLIKRMYTSHQPRPIGNQHQKVFTNLVCNQCKHLGYVPVKFYEKS